MVVICYIFTIFLVGDILFCFSTIEMRWKSPGLQVFRRLWDGAARKPKDQISGWTVLFSLVEHGFGPAARCPLLHGFLVRKMGVSIPAETHWYCWLVVTGTMEFYDFPDIGNVIIPTDIHTFQRGRYTTNQYGIFATCRSMFGVPPFWISGLRTRVWDRMRVGSLIGNFDCLIAMITVLEIPW